MNRITLQPLLTELIDGPNVSSKLLNEFRPEVKLLEDAQVKDGLVTLISTNQSIIVLRKKESLNMFLIRSFFH